MGFFLLHYVLYHHTQQHRQNFPHPPPEIVDGETEFEVESIKNHCFRGHRHKLQYLIGWKGYPSADNTWEDANQVFAPELITLYHHHHPLRDKRAHSSRRVAICSSLSCLLATLQTSLPPPPLHTMSRMSWSTSRDSSSTTTANSSQGCASMSTTPTKTHPSYPTLD